MRKPTRILAAGVLGVTLILGAGLPASAHSGGRVQLFVDRLRLQSSGGTYWALLVRLVDADSGAPQPGFDVAAEGHDRAGHTLAALPLADEGGGKYRADVAAEPGNWEFTVRADALPGGVPAVPLQKSYPVLLQAGRDVIVGASAGGGRIGVGTVVWPMLAGAAVAALAVTVSRRRRPRPVVAARRSPRSAARR